MLNKLLKYDLKSNFKFMLIFYALALFFAILTRICFAHATNLAIQIFAYIFNGTTIAMIANILINNLMRLWVYFKTNLYADEGYLMHTLPVPRKNLFTSKFLTGLIILITSTIVIVATTAIAWLTPESFEALKNFLAPMAEILDSTATEIIILMIIVVFLEVFVMLISGYIGIILGYKKLSNRTGWSILFGLICYVIIQLIILFGVFTLAGINPKIGNSLFSSEQLIPDISVLRPIYTLSIVLYLIIIALSFVLSQKWFKKIDLD